MQDISENGSELGEAVDFIDMFLNAESSDIDLNATAGSSTFDRANSRVSRRLTIDEIAAQCFVFLIAGFFLLFNKFCLPVSHFFAIFMYAIFCLNIFTINVFLLKNLLKTLENID